MTNTQLYLAIGLPILVNFGLVAALYVVLKNYIDVQFKHINETQFKHIDDQLKEIKDRLVKIEDGMKLIK